MNLIYLPKLSTPIHYVLNRLTALVHDECAKTSYGASLKMGKMYPRDDRFKIILVLP
jgi:hypothetical protein